MFSSVKNRLDLQETVGQIQIWNNPIETSTAADLDLLTIQATLTWAGAEVKILVIILGVMGKTQPYSLGTERLT